MDTEKKDPTKLADDAVAQENVAPTLTDDAISSKRALTRRSLLGTLGIIAGAAAATVFAPSQAFAADGQGRSRRCQYRDNDTITHRGGDTVRVRANCGITDNDTADAAGRSRRCGTAFRDRDTTHRHNRDTVRQVCGLTDRD